MSGILLMVAAGVFAQIPEAQSPETGLAARVDALIEDLRSEDATVRRAAIEALGGIGPDARDAIPALEAIEDDPWAVWARRRIGPGPLPFAHELLKTPSPVEDDARPHFIYELAIDATSQTIPLGPVFDDGNRQFGMDSESLFLRWLEPDRLLHVSWETVPQGTGHYQAQGNLLLLKTGAKWREILRDWRPWRSKGSIADYRYIELNFDWDQTANILTISEATSMGEIFVQPEVMAVETCTDSESSTYARATIFTTHWKANLTEDGLVIGGGTQEFQTAREQHATMNEVAQFLNQSNEVAVKRSEADHLAYLLKQTGADNGAAEADMPLPVADSLPAFEPSAEVLYSINN